MATAFDPYHVWLGVPPAEQPPNKYRLLGLRAFEENPDVIESAADRLMNYLHTLQTSKNAQLAERLSTEVAAARVALLNPQTKAAYDKELRVTLPRKTAATPLPSAQPLPVAGQIRAIPQPQTAPHPATAVPLAPSTVASNHLAGDPIAPQPAEKRTAKAAQPSNNRSQLIMLGGAVAAAAVVGLAALAFSGKSKSTLSFNWPDDQRAGAKLTVDDQPVVVPEHGPVTLEVTPGDHHIAAARAAYKLEATVNAAAGQMVEVPVAWKPKSTLALSWPVSNRAGATLTIDGVLTPMSGDDPWELPIEPGTHAIRIAKDGVALLDTRVVLAADQRQPLRVPDKPVMGAIGLDWPLGERAFATLTLDGVAVPIDAAKRNFTIPASIGKHTVRLTRRGYLPYELLVGASTGELMVVRPWWQALPSPIAQTDKPSTTTSPNSGSPDVGLSEPDVKPAPDTPSPVNPAAAPTVVEKLPAPGAAELAAVNKDLDQLYKPAQSPQKNHETAVELIRLSGDAKSKPIERYAMLSRAAQYAATAGDVTTAFQAADQLDSLFKLDVLELKQKLLEEAINRAATKQQTADVAAGVEPLVKQAATADRFDAALAVVALGVKAANKTALETAARKDLQARITRWRSQLESLKSGAATAQEAQAALAKDAHDAAAAAVLGRWLCLQRNDWQQGLPLLAKSADAKLKPLAEAELKAPSEPQKLSELADAWWDQAQKEQPAARDALRAHAATLYQAALDQLKSGITKTIAEKRIADAAAWQPLIEPPRAMPAAGQADAAPARIPLNQWVDLLTPVDFKTDVVEGDWSRDGAAIVATTSNQSRLTLPVIANGSFDLTYKFTRSNGKGDVNLMFPVADRACAFMMSFGDGYASALSQIDGHRYNDSDNPARLQPAGIESDREYTVLVKVRLKPDGNASIAIDLDGRPYLPPWEGPAASILPDPFWRSANPTKFCLAGYKDKIRFQDVKLRMLSGSARWDTVSAASAPPVVEAPGKPGADGALPPGQWVDVLKLVDVASDAYRGDWWRRGQEVHERGNHSARLEIPVALDGSYDFEVRFIRTRNRGDVNVMFPVGDRTTCFHISAYGGGYSGIANIDGKFLDKPENTTKIEPGEIENFHPQTALLKVRHAPDGQSSIEVSLNGKPYLPRWEGNSGSLSVDWNWKVPDRRAIYFGCYDNDTTYQTARLKLVDGSAHVKSAEPFVQTNEIGGDGGDRFVDIGPPGAILAGLHVVKGDIVHQIQPIYRTAEGKIVRGPDFGSDGGDSMEAIARDGYAIAGLMAKAGNQVDGFRLIFMRLRNGQLDPSDRYESEWLGGRGGAGEKALGGSGTPLVGIHGRAGLRLDALGVVLASAAGTQRAPRQVVAAASGGVDLLAGVDPANDAVRGRWKLQDGELSFTAGGMGAIDLGYVPPEEYDFEISFTRQQAREATCQLCFARGHRLLWAMGAWEGTVSGFQLIDRLTCRDNPTHCEAAMEPNQRYTSLVKVRRDGVEAFVDGQSVAKWKTNYEDMSSDDYADFPRQDTLSLMSWTPTVFHSARIVEVTGKGHFAERRFVATK